MKYFLGSLIISFGIMLVSIILLISLQVKAPENSLQYFGFAWLILALVCYPLAKKIMR